MFRAASFATAHSLCDQVFSEGKVGILTPLSIDSRGGWRKVPKCNDWGMVSRWSEIRWIHTNSVTLNFYVREGCGVHRG